jgi:non-canonical (house-cleaning) NTP pyrophosphatase
MNLLTTESHLNPVLQVADLVVGITTGMCTPQRNYALQYWEIVKHNFHRNQNGEVMGCGLKVFPNEIVGEIHATLFSEEVDETGDSEESYEE